MTQILVWVVVALVITVFDRIGKALQRGRGHEAEAGSSASSRPTVSVSDTPGVLLDINIPRPRRQARNTAAAAAPAAAATPSPLPHSNHEQLCEPLPEEGVSILGDTLEAGEKAAFAAEADVPELSRQQHFERWRQAIIDSEVLTRHAF